MKWTPPDTDFVLPILTIVPQILVGYNEGVSPPVLCMLVQTQWVANAPRSCAAPTLFLHTQLPLKHLAGNCGSTAFW